MKFKYQQLWSDVCLSLQPSQIVLYFDDSPKLPILDSELYLKNCKAFSDEIKSISAWSVQIN